MFRLISRGFLQKYIGPVINTGEYGQITVLQTLCSNSKRSKSKDYIMKIYKTKHQSLLTEHKCFHSGDKFSVDSASDSEVDSKTDDFHKSEFLTSLNVDDFEDVEEFSDSEDVEAAWVPPVSLNRGKDGIFDLDDVIELLHDAKANELCVLQIPKALNFVDYMVIVSALSYRHMVVIANNIKRVHKKRRGKKDRHLKIEGLNSKTWFAMDMGNIMLHIFMPETREIYNIESLWTVGEEFDAINQEEITNNIFSLTEALILGVKNIQQQDLHSDELGLDNRPTG